MLLYTQVGTCTINIVIAKQPRRFLEKCTQSDYDKIYGVLSELPDLGNLHGKIAKMQGRENEFRIKLPPFRIIFKYDKKNKVVTVTRIETRGNAYMKG